MDNVHINPEYTDTVSGLKRELQILRDVYGVTEEDTTVNHDKDKSKTMKVKRSK